MVNDRLMATQGLSMQWMMDGNLESVRDTDAWTCQQLAVFAT